MSLLIYSILFLLIILSTAYTVRSSKYKISYINFKFTPVKLSVGIIICFLVYVIVRTYAYNTGADYLAYFFHYVARTHNVIDAWGEGREVGYRTLIDILSSKFDEPYIFFAICALLGLGSVLYASLKFGQAAPFIVLGWVIFMFNLSTNLYRQYISFAFLLISASILISKQNKKHIVLCVIFIILAYLFHRSSIVGVVMLSAIYFLRNIKINRWIWIIGLLITTVSSMTILYNLLETFGTYSNMFMQMNDRSYMADELFDSVYDSSRMAYINMIAGMIMLWYGDKVMKKSQLLRYLFYVYAISLLVGPLMRQEILMRMRLYLTNIGFIAYGLIIYFNVKYFRLKSNMILYIVLIYQIAYFYFYQNASLFTDFPLIFK